jgi:hypothetical protein
MNATILPFLKYEVYIIIIVKYLPFGFKILHSIKLIHIYNKKKIHQQDSPTSSILRLLRRQVITFNMKLLAYVIILVDVVIIWLAIW